MNAIALLVLILLCPGAIQDPTPSAESILKRLSDSNPVVRRQAIWHASEHEIKEAAPRLLELLGDTEYTVALAAASALEDLEIRIDATALLGRVRAGTVDYGAADTLLETWCGPAHAPAILEALRDESCEWRRSAFHLLEAIKARDAIPVALKWIADPNHPLREEAAFHLARLEVREAVPLLWEWALSKEKHNCLVPIRCLTNMRVEGAGVQIMAILRDGDEIHQFRHDCGFMVGFEYRDFQELMRNTPDASVVPALHDWTKDPTPRLRALGAQLLGWIRHRPSAPRLKELASDPDPAVAAEAAESLAGLKLKEYLPYFRALAAKGSISLRCVAAEALGGVGGPEAVGILKRMTGDADAEVRRGALEALAEAAPGDCISEIVRALEDKSHWVLQGAIGLARSLKHPATAAPLARLVDAPDEHVRGDARKALLALRAHGQAGEIERRMAGLPRFERLDAAAIACSLGSRRAGEILLAEAIRGEDVSLAPLNALRTPPAWEKIVTLTVGPEKFSFAQLLGDSAVRVGVPFQRPATLDRRTRRKLDERSTPWGWSSMDEILCFWDEGDILVNPDGLRIATRGESIEFWKKWLAETSDR